MFTIETKKTSVRREFFNGSDFVFRRIEGAAIWNEKRRQSNQENDAGKNFNRKQIDLVENEKEFRKRKKQIQPEIEFVRRSFRLIAEERKEEVNRRRSDSISRKIRISN